jgi:class 3 adenylate cyclase
MSCASCGVTISGDVRFCPHCGASQAPSGEERRVVTVLFADIVGFTALAERLDPEEIKHVVDRAFERLARDINAFGGVIDKVLGDGIIALFGAPVAHEDDAERAVRGALSMQKTLASLASLGNEMAPALEMRIGVNTGEVLVGTTTAGGDYTAMGDVMNLAHRLQELAEPGETLVGDDTRRATGDAITYRAVGTLPARGREAPIEAWVAIEAIRPPGSHRTRGGVFVGRRDELDLLAAQARLAVDENRAQLALVIGEAGIGKTRLVTEASTRVADQFDARVLEGRCLPYGEANVWWPVAELVRGLFSLSLDAPHPETDTRLREALARHLAPVDEADVRRYTTALLHALGYDTPLRGRDRVRNRSEVMLAVTGVLEAELAIRPVVLVVSDMHWAPAAVWKLIEHLLGELARSQLLVLTTARPVEGAQLSPGRHGSSVIQLGPLDDSASVELLERLGLDLPEISRVELIDRSGGNPFFLEELAGLVAKEEGAVDERADSEFDIAHVDSLPATLRGTISARLDALDTGERGLIEDASVLGRTGSLEGLASLASESRGVTDVTVPLAELVEKDLLELSGHRYRFRSNLVRDVAYGRLTKTVRAQRHYGIAHHLEVKQGEIVRNSVVVAIAEHFRAAAQLSAEVSDVPGVDRGNAVERALYWLEQAGERALDVGAPMQAARWFDAGVELAEDDAGLARFLFGRSRARTEIHDLTGARSDLDRLEALPDPDPVLAARALLVRGEADRKAGYADRAASRLAEAASRLAVLGAASQQALALRLLGMTEMGRDDGAARAAFERSQEVATAAGDRRAEAWALQSRAWHAFSQGRVLEAATLVTEAVDIFTELDDQGGLVWTQGVQAWVAFHTGDWDTARELVDAVLPETRRRGDPWAECIMLNLDATLLLWSGQAGLAAESAREARTVAERVEYVNLLVQARALEGRALVSVGRIDEGTELLESAYSLAEQADDRESRRVAVVANCASAARLGEPERALRWASRYDGLGDPAAIGRSDLEVALAAAQLQRGAIDDAAAQLQSVADAADRPGRYAEAVGAIVAAAGGHVDRSEELTDAALTGPSTYLDRLLALLARVAARHQEEDAAGRDEALAEARSLIAPTDDEPSRLLIDLVAALCGRGSVVAAEHHMRGGGLDPTGWLRAFTLAAHRPVG